MPRKNFQNGWKIKERKLCQKKKKKKSVRAIVLVAMKK